MNDTPAKIDVSKPRPAAPGPQLPQVPQQRRPKQKKQGWFETVLDIVSIFG
jgi:hypothetical protein